VRFVAATHRDLAAMIAAGTFRQDLYFRLNGITMTIPPLRERVGEIERLAKIFVARAAEAAGVPTPPLSAGALDLLRAHRWPGNIRELRNVIERAVLLAEDTITEAAILLEHAPDPARPRVVDPAIANERDQILAALAAAAGNQKVAAQMLGISRRTLINRLEQYGIARPRKTALELE
jgi:two-component system, NtrC family, response regulator AtoC